MNVNEPAKSDGNGKYGKIDGSGTGTAEREIATAAGRYRSELCKVSGESYVDARSSAEPTPSPSDVDEALLSYLTQTYKLSPRKTANIMSGLNET